MHNVELIENICNLVYTNKEKNIRLDKVNYDLNDPFKKYYRLELIINAILKYENKEFSIDELKGWANSYDWIISGGFNEELYEEMIENNPLVYYIIASISSTLKSLALINDDDVIYFKNAFTKLDEVLNNIDSWDFFYSSLDLELEEEVSVLIVNEDNKEFTRLNLSFMADLSDANELELSDLDDLECQYKENGFVDFLD